MSQLGGAKGGDSGSSAQRTPIIQADTVRSKAMVEVIEAWGWGQIEGFATTDPLMSIKLDGTPIKAPDGTLNFQGITVDYRLGTQDQDYIKGTLEDATGSPINVGTPVVHATPITKTVNDTTTDAVRIIITYASLVSQNMVNGDRSSVTVELKIEVKPLGASAWTLVDLQGRGRIYDKIESPYQRAFTVNLKAIDNLATSYDVRVTRVSADPVSNATVSEQSAFTWDSYVKLTYAKLRRPNVPHIRLLFDARYFSSVPVRSYDLKGMLVQVPPASVYDPVNRTYVPGATWDGTLVMRWCRCPAWVLYHLLTTGGIGLGSEINQAYQDKWSIFTIAKRCDETVPDGAGGVEPRYSIDAQFMAQVSAHEMVNQLAGIFDAMPLWDGKSVYLTQDAPKAVSSLYTPANVVGGRFVYQGSARQTRYTAAMIQYNDLTDQSRLATEYVEDFTAIERYGYRPITETAIGCTSRAQAHRRGKRLLITGRDEIDAVTFSVGLSGITCKPGDITRIADPLKSGGKRLGGRLSSGSTTTVIKLDSTIILESGKSYRLAIIGNDGLVTDSAITTVAGTVSNITVSPAFSTAPETELEFIVYTQADVSRLFRILGITENEDAQQGFYTISATQYSSTKFADIDSIADLTPLPANPYQVASVAPPSGILFNEGVYTGLEGLTRYLDISWSASNDMLLRGYHLVYRHNGIVLFDSEVTGQTYRIISPLTGTYEVTISSVNVTGKYSTSITLSHTMGELYPIESVSVTGLALKTGGTTFAGKQPEFIWDTDALAVLGFSTTYAAGKGGQSPWFRDFQVDIYNPDDPIVPAPVLRTDYITESAYTYTFEKNLQDGGPHRKVKAIVRARDQYGRYSTGMQLSVSNPAPNTILASSVSIFSGYKSVIIKYTQPSDNDWSGIVVFMGTTANFVPAPANRVFMGPDLSVVIADLTEGTYYFRLAAYDAFGSATDYSLTAETFTKTIGVVAGASLFTWVKYADTPTTGMSDVSTDKTYIGIAYNKNTATESTDYAVYEWSNFKGATGAASTVAGPQGLIGPPGKDGFVFNPTINADFAGATLPTGFTFAGTKATSDSGTTTTFTNDIADRNLLVSGVTAKFPLIPTDNYLIVIRIKWISGAWEGRFYYNNAVVTPVSGHGYTTTANQYITMPAPALGEWSLITIDTRELSADYITGADLNGLRFDFVNAANASFALDYIMVGKYGVPDISGVDIKTKLQEALNDPTVTPLVFEADAFAIKLNGLDKTPFIIGNISGAPAILLDADVHVTGKLKASQLESGRIAATEALTVGNGGIVIDGGDTGDSSIIIYDGADTIANRDFALLSSGDVDFFKYRGGAYRQYKNIHRVEYGTAKSGTTVTIPGYWDAQPKLQVSPNALTSFLPASVAQSQAWQIRADNLIETAVGSKQWKFDAVAQLTLSSGAGTATVTSASGANTTGSFTSGESALYANTASVTVSVNFSSVKGDGISTYGYFYRTVTWTIQGFKPSTGLWVTLGSKVRALTKAEHGTTITDTKAVNVGALYTKIRVVFAAANTNATKYSLGADAYNYSTGNVASNGAGLTVTAADSWESWGYPNNPTGTLTSASYSTPSGWEIYQIEYKLNSWWHTSGYFTGVTDIENGNDGWAAYSDTKAYTTNNYLYDFIPYRGASNQVQSGITSGILPTTTFNASFWKATVTGRWHNYDGILYIGVAQFHIQDPSATVYIRQIIKNSATQANTFTFSNYAWSVTGSTAIATGSLNYIAIGN